MEISYNSPLYTARFKTHHVDTPARGSWYLRIGLVLNYNWLTCPLDATMYGLPVTVQVMLPHEGMGAVGAAQLVLAPMLLIYVASQA